MKETSGFHVTRGKSSSVSCTSVIYNGAGVFSVVLTTYKDTSCTESYLAYRILTNIFRLGVNLRHYHRQTMQKDLGSIPGVKTEISVATTVGE